MAGITHSILASTTRLAIKPAATVRFDPQVLDESARSKFSGASNERDCNALNYEV